MTAPAGRPSPKKVDRNTRRCPKAAKHRPGENHPSATGQADSQPGVSWRIDRSGRNGWIGQEHAALFAEAVAGNWRIPAAFHGMEFVAAGEIGDAAREAAAVADAYDIFAAACGGFRGPLRGADHAVTAG